MKKKSVMTVSRKTKDAPKDKTAKLENVASEKAVLAGVCRYGLDAYSEIEPIINEETFTVNENKIIYRCVKEIMAKGHSVDFSGILSSAKDLKLDEYITQNDGLKHIRAILETPINLDNVRPHALKIRRIQFARELQKKLSDGFYALQTIKGEESLSEILTKVEVPIQELSTSYLRSDENKPTDLGEGLDEYLDHIENNPCDIIGIPTGFRNYDMTIGGGLRRKAVSLVGARTKAGKSVFCDNVAFNVASRGIKVLVLDTEMSKEDHWQRMLAAISRVDIIQVGNGQYGKKPHLKEKVRAAAKQLKELPYKYINISGKPFEETISIMRRWILKEVGYTNGRMNDCLIIYDYLKLMQGAELNNNMAEFQVLGFQTTALHNFAVEYDCPILSFVQLNRDGTTKESSDVIAQSDRIGWLCSNFSILKAKTEEEIENDGVTAGNRKLVVVLARHGPGSEDSGYICLQMDKQFASMREIGLAREIKRQRETFPDADETTDSGSGEESEY